MSIPAKSLRPPPQPSPDTREREQITRFIQAAQEPLVRVPSPASAGEGQGGGQEQIQPPAPAASCSGSA